LASSPAINGFFSRFYPWLVRRLPSERQRVLAITIVAGGVCGLVAVAFHISVTHLYGLLIDRAAAAPGHSWIWWTILTPAVGGLIVGLGLYYWVPAAAGSGIPQVKVAYANRFGAITLKETIGKFVLCALQLGAGASLGVEGPTVQICAGVSSFLSRIAGLSPTNRRRMTAVGMAAGIAAAFNAPIAAVTFTLEELIGTLDQTMLSGIIVAAALAAVVEHSILGFNPIFHVPSAQNYSLPSAWSLLWYALLGLLAAIVSVAFTDSLLALRGRFKRWKSVPKWVHPAIGGAVTGGFAVVAMWFFHVNGIAGDPYKTLTQALLGNLPVTAMAALCVLKLAATVTSYSSGGSGGIFAPALFMGGMLGGAVGYLDVTILHHPYDSIGAFAMVGMGAVFAGVVRAPITSVLIIFEMTRGYGLVLPMMIANMSAFALASHWRHTPIYEALLEQDGIVLEDGKGPYEDATPAKQPVAQGQEMHAEETRPEEKHLDARS
jgi:CIC family chloride channel protein